MRIGRNGSAPGDILVAIGECGQFISAFLRARAVGFEQASDADKQRLLRPKARISEMHKLGTSGVISAATDNSDGVLGSLWNIAERSECAFELNIQPKDVPVEVNEAANAFKANVLNLMMCWGDWQVIATVRQSEFQHFKEITSKEKITHIELGSVISGPPAIYQQSDGTRKRLRVVRNENFTPTSFNADLDKHLEFMLYSNLFES